MRTLFGAPKAVVATVSQISTDCLSHAEISGTLRRSSPEQEDAQYRQRVPRRLQRQAHQLGATVVFDPV